jgi:predicted RNase H-like HicB family nuclease
MKKLKALKNLSIKLSNKEMKYKVVISEGEDGWYVVECPSIPGCVSQGKSVEEARENIKDAIQGCLQQRRICWER